MSTQSTGGTRSKPARSAGPASPLGNVTETTVKGLCQMFQIMSDPHRLKILLALAQNGPMHVTALKDMLDQSQPAVSHHLRLMRDVKIVSCERRGKNNFYSVDSSLLSSLLDQVFAEMGNGAKSIHFEEMALTFKHK